MTFGFFPPPGGFEVDLESSFPRPRPPTPRPTELLDEIAQLGFALLGGCGRSRRLLAAHPRPLLRIAPEHRDRAGDLADLVGAIFAIDLDVALAFGERRQRAG